METNPRVTPPPWRTYLGSSAVSALLWLPVSVHQYFASATTDYGRQVILQELPVTLPVYFVVFFAVALLLHRFFAPRVVRARGAEFWLLPFWTLPVAMSLYAIFSFVIVRLLHPLSGFSLGSLAAEFFLGWFFGVIAVMTFYLWAAYPLAILNQLLIRRWLRHSPILGESTNTPRRAPLPYDY